MKIAISIEALFLEVRVPISPLNTRNTLRRTISHFPHIFIPLTVRNLAIHASHAHAKCLKGREWVLHVHGEAMLGCSAELEDHVVATDTVTHQLEVLD
jgi:hypothetical protein